MFSRISASDAKKLIDENKTQIIDIRDPQAFTSGHIAGAYNLNNDNLQNFIDNADTHLATLVCCYHGNSSQGAADFLNTEKNFKQVYSIDGGIEAWKRDFEVEQ